MLTTKSLVSIYHPFTYFNLLAPFPLVNHYSVLCIYVFVFVWFGLFMYFVFVYLFVFYIPHMSEIIGICLSPSDLLHLA